LNIHYSVQATQPALQDVRAFSQGGLFPYGAIRHGDDWRPPDRISGSGSFLGVVVTVLGTTNLVLALDAAYA